MRSVRWMLPEDLATLGPGIVSVVDLSEYAHPLAAARAAEAIASLPEATRGSVIPLLPPDEAPWWRRVAEGAQTVALDRLRDASQAAALADRVPPHARVVARLRGGAALHHAEPIVEALRDALDGRLTGIWYAAADLLVDFRDDPGAHYFVDLDEPRLAAPGWVRSRCLTVAQAHGLELWGQLDLSFDDPPAAEELGRAWRLAEAAAFDVLVESDRGGD